jgi:hypothetical protein
MTQIDMVSDYIVYSRYHEVVRAAHLARLERQRQAEQAETLLSMKVVPALTALRHGIRTYLQPIFVRPLVFFKWS